MKIEELKKMNEQIDELSHAYAELKKNNQSNKYIDDSYAMDIGNLVADRSELLKQANEHLLYFSVGENILCTSAPKDLVDRCILEKKNIDTFTDHDLENLLHSKGHIAFIIDTNGDLFKTDW